jgi:hypothetical protein
MGYREMSGKKPVFPFKEQNLLGKAGFFLDSRNFFAILE